MDEADDDSGKRRKARRRRIPIACGCCRYSKARCDGQKPCSRCRALKKVCRYEERPKDGSEIHIKELEEEVKGLRARLGAADYGPNREYAGSGLQFPPETRQTTDSTQVAFEPLISSPTNITNPENNGSIGGADPDQAVESPLSTERPRLTRKRKSSHFVAGSTSAPGLIFSGLLTEEQSKVYFRAFFDGCDEYVPIFDPGYDSLPSVRLRSSLLFMVICTVGCRVICGSESNQWRQLNFHIKRILNAAITTPAMACLETVQALLVRACYVSERSLLVAVATRMALDLGFPDAYEELTSRLITNEEHAFLEGAKDESTLMRETRTWLHLHVMGHILQVDAGDLPNFQFRGDVRRCRILLDSQHASNLDFFLIAQVELNALRSKVYESLSNGISMDKVDDGDIMELVKDAKIDIEIWFKDWLRILEKSEEQIAGLQLKLNIQRYWAETMAMCRAVRATGVENVDAMSPTQKAILSMAKYALREHLIIITKEPRTYLRNLRFAMDFVWAKCAYCYLLLLKLSLLLPEDSQRSGRDLIEKGRILTEELSNTGGGGGNGGHSTTARTYVQLLETCIEKYAHALDGGRAQGPAYNTPRVEDPANVSTNSPNELESFVPEQFVFEWDFPGLTLFSSPTNEAGWIDDLLLGALNGGEEFYGVGWGGLDPTESWST